MTTGREEADENTTDNDNQPSSTASVGTHKTMNSEDCTMVAKCKSEYELTKRRVRH